MQEIIVLHLSRPRAIVRRLAHLYGDIVGSFTSFRTKARLHSHDSYTLI